MAKLPQLQKSTTIIVSLLYLIATLSITAALFMSHQAHWFYFLIYPAAMLIARFHPQSNWRNTAAVVGIIMLTLGIAIDHVVIDDIEEVFILIPLSYLILYPGTFRPLAVTFLILFCYGLKTTEAQLDEFIEDALELSGISFFATFMVYYQRALAKKMALLKVESHTDFLTQLSNRRQFYADLAEIKPGSTQAQHALLHIDMNNFKSVNDQFGNKHGDSLLKEFSQSLKVLNNDKSALYRLGGDEFAIVVTDQHDLVSECEKVVEHIHEITSKGHFLFNRSFEITTSIGIALFDETCEATEHWCHNVVVALNKAKAIGRNAVQWYDEALSKESDYQNRIEKDLHTAIEYDQFYIVYQPKVNFSDGKIEDVEALIRWRHPEFGLVQPLKFIPIAEQNHQIIPIGRWVIDKACQQAQIWKNQGRSISIAVNVSAVQLANDDIFEVVTSALNQYQLPSSALQIEVTETALMDHQNKMVETCHKLREIGVKVAVDDFGVSYSSLSYLKYLPIDILKVDKAFIDDCVSDQKDLAIVRTIIRLGKELNLHIVAEGVEDAEQELLLRNEGCDKYQGFYFSRPVSASQLEQLI
ncbi:bifunctional diguanylate cyclase/phosphodiesterase [Vibrio makurazakiensis]|uniref:putative bifunctional diguanylate cyclase/phosphodiesterase n=1 Tax=Vibrio makurazakiensis TaxID=2910250 RepID=UPI003D12A8EC